MHRDGIDVDVVLAPIKLVDIVEMSHFNSPVDFRRLKPKK